MLFGAVHAILLPVMLSLIWPSYVDVSDESKSENKEIDVSSSSHENGIAIIETQK